LETIRKDILVKGRFNVWNIKDWAFIVLAITLLAVGIFLLSSPDLRTYSYYPLIGAVPFIVILAIRIMLLGNFQITKHNIVWKTLVSSIRTYSFDNIGYMSFEYNKSGQASWLVNNTQGKKVRRFNSLSPVHAAGAAILFFRYKDILPEVVFNLWNPMSKGRRTYENVAYRLKIDGSLAQDATGSIVLFENKLLYIPSDTGGELSAAESERIRKAGFIPEHMTYPADGNIKTHTLIEALLESNLPTAIRDSYIHRIVNENGGHIFSEMNRTGKQWQTFNEGVEVIIVRP